MYVNVVFMEMVTLNPHMTSLILNYQSSQITNIDCASKCKAKKCNSINSSFQFLNSFIFSESQNLLFFKISSDVIRRCVHCYKNRLYLYWSHLEYLTILYNLGLDCPQKCYSIEDVSQSDSNENA